MLEISGVSLVRLAASSSQQVLRTADCTVLRKTAYYAGQCSASFSGVNSIDHWQLRRLRTELICCRLAVLDEYGEEMNAIRHEGGQAGRLAPMRELPFIVVQRSQRGTLEV